MASKPQHVIVTEMQGPGVGAGWRGVVSVPQEVEANPGRALRGLRTSRVQAQLCFPAGAQQTAVTEL